MSEHKKEKLDRELIELLNELRVMVTGVQVLFAFLLGVAFSQRFETLTPLDRDIYFATLLCAAVATIVLIAPASYHRMLFRYHQKSHLIFVANRMALSGSVFLALSVSGVLFLITDVLFTVAAAIVVTVLAMCVAGGMWFLLPITQRGERRDLEDEPDSA